MHALEEERALLLASLDQAAELRRQWEEAMQSAETEVLRERAEHAAALASLQNLAAASRADAATHLAARQQARAPWGLACAAQRCALRANLAAAACAAACAARRRIWPRSAADARRGTCLHRRRRKLSWSGCAARATAHPPLPRRRRRVQSAPSARARRRSASATSHVPKLVRHPLQRVNGQSTLCYALFARLSVFVFALLF